MTVQIGDVVGVVIGRGKKQAVVRCRVFSCGADEGGRTWFLGTVLAVPSQLSDMLELHQVLTFSEKHLAQPLAVVKEVEA